ncbi:hypothetical protein EJ08DRAFT_131702 [Tothia fuscella]|uniref:Uncharacterized protein n=1 Tax=Tothia fuscella TaxID=1048955 RepID=A0A9P4NWC0_9PEZI|nr:hypothetical protein EJ08DRAFT_131702 [Tothia fuscella]
MSKFKGTVAQQLVAPGPAQKWEQNSLQKLMGHFSVFPDHVKAIGSYQGMHFEMRDYMHGDESNETLSEADSEDLVPSDLRRIEVEEEFLDLDVVLLADGLEGVHENGDLEDESTEGLSEVAESECAQENGREEDAEMGNCTKTEHESDMTNFTARLAAYFISLEPGRLESERLELANRS